MDELKTLKFQDKLADMIIEGEKTITWRINDDKDIQEGDEIALIRRPSMKEFGRAEVIKVKETTFGEMAPEDYEGHEKFKTKDEMYKTYSKYYNMEVTPKTKLKVITLRIMGEPISKIL